MPVQNIDVAIRDLSVGTALDSDVLDSSGIVLLRKGQVLTQDIVDGWMRRGFARVLLRRYDDHESEDGLDSAEARQLVRPYDPKLVEQLSECFLQAKQAVDEVVVQLAMREEADTSELNVVSQVYFEAIQRDTGVVLSNVASQKVEAGESSSHALARRSIQLAMLGAATAGTLGLTREECNAITIAGMLHDVSLFEASLQMLHSDQQTPDERRDVYFRHSLHSAELFSRSEGVSELVRIVISQVHEQIDGHGFPRGLSGHHLNTLSRILNIADAYLTLIEPNQSQPAYVPSDAVAYLVNHTNNGAFDRDCMKAFLNAVSIYSVGSKVLLDDSRTATVMRSSRTDPLRPIIRVDDGTESIIDLRRTKLNVARPTLDPAFPHRRRLPKAQMQTVLWKPLY